MGARVRQGVRRVTREERPAYQRDDRGVQRQLRNTGWLGIAQIWASGEHITQAITKVNDSYFNTPTHNRPEWRRLVMCQEVAHDFGLDHQDENFSNTNLGSCMDYTSNPLGPPSNEHPTWHDYQELSSIYSHLDGTKTTKTTKKA